MPASRSSIHGSFLSRASAQAGMRALRQGLAGMTRLEELSLDGVPVQRFEQLAELLGVLPSLRRLKLSDVSLDEATERVEAERAALVEDLRELFAQVEIV